MGLRPIGSRLVILGFLAFSMLFASIAFAEPIELVLWGNPRHVAQLQPMIDEFNASQDRIFVNVIQREPNPDPVLAAYLAEDLPDIIESAGRFTQQYAREGLMVDLTPYIEREGPHFIADFIPATFPDNMVDGRFYSLPAFLQIEGIYYNPVVLGQAGVAAPQPGWDWNDLRVAATKARRYLPDGTNETWGIISEGHFQTDFPWLVQAGGQMVTSDLQVTANSSEVRETFAHIQNLIELDLLRRSGGLGIDKWMHHSAFSTSATYRQDRFDSNNSAFTTAPPLRADASREPATRFSDRSWGIMSTDPDKQAAAWEVLKYLVSPEVNARWNAALGYPPATRSAIQHDAFRELVDRSENMRVWVTQWTTVQARRAFPIELEADFIASDGPALIGQFWAQEMPLEHFVSEMERVFTTIVSNFKSHYGN